MKNIEKYLDQLIDCDETWMCECCKLRCGYAPEEMDCTQEYCDAQVALNKQWLKAEYVPKEAVYVLRTIDPYWTHIRRYMSEVVVATDDIDSSMPLPLPETYSELPLNGLIDCTIFEFLPINKGVLIHDILDKYKDIY